MTDSLQQPGKLGALALRNRVVMAPLTRARADSDRVPTDVMVDYYTQRAGAGLVISEATTVSPQANGWADSPGIYTDAQAEGWRRVVDSVHAAGGTMVLQLWHTGRASHSSFLGGEPPVAPSAIAIDGEGVHTPEGKQPHEVPRALRADELPGIVADYVAAARRALEVGFDGVEVHCANGYLLDEFLQSCSNQRDDDYGGSVEKRLRFPLEVVRAVCETVGAERVGVRLSPNGAFNGMGSADYRETFSAMARELDGLGLAYLHVMDGLGFGFHELGEPMTLADFGQLFSGALIGNCGYSQETAEAAIARGDADAIAFGRPFISNPDLPARFANGWPLAPEADPSTWYLSGMGAKGYSDFPAYEAEGAQA